MSTSRISARLRADQGMTIAEVMVALLVLAIASMAVLNLATAAVHNSYRGEQSQVVSNRLQQEMEKIQNLPYGQIALTGLPADSTNTSDPAWRLEGSSYSVTQDGTQPEPLVYNGSSLYTGGTVSGGTVDPTPTHFTSGDVGGTIYRYVVWENDDSCSETDCPGSQDMKRIIVAIVLDTTPVGGARHYQELQGQVTDPKAAPPDNTNPLPGGNNTSHPWTFWLTDTSCANSTRQVVTGDHLTHNTRGLCATGVKSGNDPGAPDLMVNQAAPLTAETPLYDYATDVEPSQNPDQDKGLQMLRGETTTCDPQALSVATAAEQDQPTRFQELHEWLSAPIPSGYDVALDGTGTLNLWSQTVNAASYAGKVCVWLFVQSTDAGGNTVRTAATNPTTGISYFTYSQAAWPTGWAELHVGLTFSLTQHLSQGARLGLIIGVDRDGTGGDGIQVLYDEPSFDTRLQLDTHSDVPSI